jgi:hypothetical protein
MLRRSVIPLLLTAIATGCGGGEAKSLSATPEQRSQSRADQQTRADKQTDAAPAKSAAPTKPPAPPVIYSSRELAKVLDLSALPALAGTDFEHQSAAKATAQVSGTVPEVSAFYQKNLADLGWEVVPDPNRKNTAEYAFLRFEKNGHRASFEISEYSAPKGKGPRTLAIMEFQGNLDTRTLPSPPGKQVLLASQTVTAHLTELTLAEATAWAPKALAAEGWQAFTGFDNPKQQTGAFRTLHFRKQGYALMVFIGIHPLHKKTHFQYMVSALGHELPTPPGAAKVQFNYVRWKLSCEVPGDWKAAAAFYQKAMPETGYQPLPSEDPRPTYWNLRFGTEAGDVIMVQVSSKDGQITRVDIDGISAAVLAAIKKRDEERKPSRK